MNNPVALIIMDGWGMRDAVEGNAIKQANTPNVDKWTAEHERAVLDASGEEVGLPVGQMGNSEVGHLNLGAGRIIYQDITRIDKTIRDGELENIDLLRDAISLAHNGLINLHIIGLQGTGGVHGHSRHMNALLDLAKKGGVNPIIHVITDGRDTPPESGAGFVEALEQKVSELGVGRIATISGRYYAMDRDKRWERTQAAYETIVNQNAPTRFQSASAAVAASYAAGITDEFVVPATIEGHENCKVKSGDVLLFFNFRADRMRQIVRPFVVPGFDDFEREPIEDLSILSMTKYADDLPTKILFPERQISMTLAETLSKAGKTQLHAAETEKYPHVTFFFNGGEEAPFEGETRIMAQSPKVATYDLQPEMSAFELTEKVMAHIKEEKPDFILVNFANPDMVGHTGSIKAAIKAVETVDTCASKLVELVTSLGGTALVTADHGNCERMVELLTGEPHTYHTTNPVAILAISNSYLLLRPRGILADVAPTVLDLLGVKQPEEMTGESLIVR
ncbi:MAG: 2,3-bisphosphoglycerate-independent phosphoglycerate mutase [Cellvibrionaceae bacterium]|jgi:2,3-bisphosphoglycerate-independent phosphoglycerate mutase